MTMPQMSRFAAFHFADEPVGVSVRPGFDLYRDVSDAKAG